MHDQETERRATVISAFVLILPSKDFTYIYICISIYTHRDKLYICMSRFAVIFSGSRFCKSWHGGVLSTQLQWALWSHLAGLHSGQKDTSEKPCGGWTLLPLCGRTNVWILCSFLHISYGEWFQIKPPVFCRAEKSVRWLWRNSR